MILRTGLRHSEPVTLELAIVIEDVAIYIASSITYLNALDKSSVHSSDIACMQIAVILQHNYIELLAICIYSYIINH